jgi:hypothetical protein
MKDLVKIIQRFERGYTATLYGTVDLAKSQKECDFIELVGLVKELNTHIVNQQHKLLFDFQKWFIEQGTNNAPMIEHIKEYINK